jgi:HlyD family secretion protein
MIAKIKQFIKNHKFVSGIIIIVLVIVGYLIIKPLFSKPAQVTYVLGTVSKGTIISSISGSGQVSASNQVDIKAKASGDIIYTNVKNGQEVKINTLIAQIDTSDAQKALQDAEINLEAAQVNLEKLLEPTDELTLLQAESALVKAQQAKQDAEDGIGQGYEDALSAITSAFFDLPTIITDLNNILYSYEIANTEKTLSGNWNISALLNSVNDENRSELQGLINSAEDDYNEASIKYNANFINYKKVTLYSEHDVIGTLLSETLETVKAMAQATKSDINLLDFWVNYRSQRNLSVFSNVTGYQTDLKSYNSKLNTYLSNLLSIQRSFEDNRAVVVDAEYTVEEKELSLEDLKEGADDLDIRTQKNVIRQKQDALITAKENLASCYVRAPFDGVITSLDVKTRDSVSNGTTIATIITNQQIAKISLNEIDVAKVKIGQKATLTFDAIDGLTISGEVLEVDIIGTVSQGVVTYNVKIGFDTQDDRIKSGMSASASVITNMKQDVLMVPSSAIKSSGNIFYVEIPNEQVTPSTNSNSGMTLQSIPKQQEIQIGLTNDTGTEVTSGLKEGDTIIVRTISPSTTTTTTGTQNSIRIPGAGGFGR